jgi:hypothetical protein
VARSRAEQIHGLDNRDRVPLGSSEIEVDTEGPIRPLDLNSDAQRLTTDY